MRHLVAFQKQTVFLLKSPSAMVCRLTRNVLADGIHIGLADRKRPVPRLPGETGEFPALPLDPSG